MPFRLSICLVSARWRYQTMDFASMTHWRDSTYHKRELRRWSRAGSAGRRSKSSISAITRLRRWRRTTWSFSWTWRSSTRPSTRSKRWKRTHFWIKRDSKSCRWATINLLMPDLWVSRTSSSCIWEATQWSRWAQSFRLKSQNLQRFRVRRFMLSAFICCRSFKL